MTAPAPDAERAATTPVAPAPRRERDLGRASLRVAGHLRRTVYLAIGCAMVALALAGVFLPILPTTPFLILAAGCFARSSPRLEQWLLSHRRFGPLLRNWRDRGAIPRSGKLAAFVGMAAGFAMFYVAREPSFGLAALVATGMLAVAVYVGTRPE